MGWCRFQQRSDLRINNDLTDTTPGKTDLYLNPRTINPLSIVGHTINVAKGLDSLLDLSCIVKNTTVSVHKVDLGDTIIID